VSIVSKDWQNISKTIERNRDVVIIFDDSTYEGVSVLRREIESSALYKVFTLNFNQFFCSAQYLQIRANIVTTTDIFVVTCSANAAGQRGAIPALVQDHRQKRATARPRSARRSARRTDPNG
jgi:hypothetical protein